MNKNIFILLAGIAVVPVGCSMAPKYERPAAPVPAEWPKGAAYTESVKAGNVTNASLINWQEFFTDAQLKKVIGIALTNNRDLKLAALNVRRAQGMYGIQRDALFPSLNANGTMSRQRTPADLSSSGAATTSSRFDANFGVASWEIDFFGRITSLKDEALHTYMATEEARRNSQIVLVSSVANAYYAFAADSENLKLAVTTLEAQENSFKLIKRNHDLGLVGDLDVQLAQTQVDSAREAKARYTQVVALDKNALNLLAGGPLPEDVLKSEFGKITPPKEVHAGLPSDILLARPDVLQAEHTLKAANADIGAARAAFFPRISLTAAVGTASSELSGLFKAGSGAWSYAPQIVMPIFDARTWSAHRVAKVQREIAVTQYESAIQNAFRDVADTLAVRGTIDQQVQSQESMVHAVSEAYRLANSRYSKGLDSYLSVLDAQRSLFAAQQGLISLRLAKVSNQVRLYAVLGGGWDADPNSPATSMLSAADKTKKN